MGYRLQRLNRPMAPASNGIGRINGIALGWRGHGHRTPGESNHDFISKSITHALISDNQRRRSKARSEAEIARIRRHRRAVERVRIVSVRRRIAQDDIRAGNAGGRQNRSHRNQAIRDFHGAKVVRRRLTRKHGKLPDSSQVIKGPWMRRHVVDAKPIDPANPSVRHWLPGDRPEPRVGAGSYRRQRMITAAMIDPTRLATKSHPVFS